MWQELAEDGWQTLTVQSFVPSNLHSSGKIHKTCTTHSIGLLNIECCLLLTVRFPLRSAALRSFASPMLIVSHLSHSAN